LVGVRGGGGGSRAGGGRGGGGGGTGPGLMSAGGASVFFQGSVYDKNPNQVGPKNFIDKIAIKTGEKQRIYESENTGVSERVSTIVDAEGKRFIVTRESPTEVPQNFLLDLGGGGRRIQLTKNVDVHEDLTRAKIERFVFGRPPGSNFGVKVGCAHTG